MLSLPALADTSITGDEMSCAYELGTFSATFSTARVDGTQYFTNQYVGRPFNDVFYKFTITKRMRITIDHEGSSVSDTYVHLLNSSGTRIAYNDDWSGEGHCTSTYNSFLQQELDAGTYYIVSEGYSQNGVIRTNIHGSVVTIPGDNMSNPVSIGTKSSDFTYSNTQNTNNFSNVYSGKSTKDVYHKLVLTSPMNVTFTHEGSSVSDTYMYLLNSSGSLITSNDDYSGDGQCTNNRHSFIQRSLAAGTYYIVSEGYSQNGEIKLNISGTTSHGYGYSSLPSSYSTNTTNAVGGMGGSFQVSEMGGAIYTIPIEVPVGVHGLQPNISLVYNSQSGNGIAGMGTSLAGFSSITRAPKDILHDGATSGMKYLGDDAFYLDGTRLILKSGTSGEDGAVFVAENDPYTQIIQHGTCYTGANYMWFEIVYQDGTKAYFGYSTGRNTYTDGSNNQKTMSWNVDYMEDPYGNTMTIEYVKYNYVIYPSQIVYGMSNTSANNLRNYVNFSYSTRSDVTKSKFDGVDCIMDRRLSTITTKTGSTTYRTYTLNYNTTSDGSATKYSRLTSVSEANGSNQSLSPVQLTWSYLPNTSISSSAMNINTTGTGSNAIPFGNQSFGVCDINGDGIDDIIGFGKGEDGDRKFYVYKYLSSRASNGSVSFSLNHQMSFTPSYTTMSGDVSNYLINKLAQATSNGRSKIIDHNGDGMSELLLSRTYWMYYNDLQKWMEFYLIGASDQVDVFGAHLLTDCEPVYDAGDIDNDGRTDIVALETRSDDMGYFKLHIMSSSIGLDGNTLDGWGQTVPNTADFTIVLRNRPVGLYLTDMNGNGLQDILVMYNDGYSVLWNQGGNIQCGTTKFMGTFNGTSDTYYCHNGFELTSQYQMYPGDFNGDGLLDFLTNDGSYTWYFWLNNGKGSFNCNAACNLDYRNESYTGKDDGRVQASVFDIDNDGKSDVVITISHYERDHNWLGQEWGNYERTRTYWLRSTGTGLSAIHYSDYCNEDVFGGTFLTGDFDGDGRTEFISNGYDFWSGAAPNGFKLYEVPSYTSNTGLVTSITGDYGVTTSITYSTLADNSVYSRGSVASYPAPVITAPLKVVKSVSVSNGAASGNVQTNYIYSRLRTHRCGRGILGFEKTTATNTTMGIVAEKGINSWSTEYWLPIVEYTSNTVGGVTTSNTVNSTIYSQNNVSYFKYPTLKTAVDEYGNETKTYYTFNLENGQLTTEYINYGQGLTQETKFENFVSAGRRLQPQKVTLTKKHSDDNANYVNETLYSYDTTTGNITQKVENSNSNLPLTTTYTYDSHGNMFSEKSSGNGVGEFTQYYNYDATGRFIVSLNSSPSATQTNFTYDTWGNKLTETDGTNSSSPITTTYSYDNWGHLLSVNYPTGASEKYTYGWNNNNSKRYFVLKEGSSTPWVKTWYDNRGREVLIESIGPKDIVIKKQTNYNSKGQVTSVVETSGNLVTTKSYTYDNRGRVISESKNDGSSVQYQYGNRSLSIISNNRTTYQSFDACGNIKEVVDPVSSVDYYYSSIGQVKRIVTEGMTYEYSYDIAGNKVSYTDPDAGTTYYSYDALGRETGHTDSRNVHFSTSYDVFGRVTSTSANNETINYTYGTSGNGKMRLIRKELGSWYDTYEYDTYGRVTEQYVGGHSTKYQYNPAGLVTRKTWADGGETSKYVDYTYDSYGNHIGSNAISGAVVWNLTQATGKVTSSTIQLHSNSNLYTRTTTLDNYGYPSSYSLTRNGSSVNGESYAFNYGTGNMTQCTKYYGTEAYHYDDVDRLTSVDMDGHQAMTILYYSNGNIYNKSDVGSYSYSSNSHRMTSVENWAGTIPYSNQEVIYNAWGKVSEVREYVGSDFYKYEIQYGPDLQRTMGILWKNGNLVHHVTYGDEYEEKYQNGQITRYYYVNGSDGNSAVYTSHTQTGNKAYCIDHDHLGSITGLYDQNGNKCFGAVYDPWGRRYVDAGSIEYDRGYTGHEHIDEIYLVDMNGRMYDPTLGRFISVDPLIQDPLNSQNFNGYAYCYNNPMKYTDPSGESVVGALIIGAVIGAYSGGVIANGDLNPGTWSWDSNTWSSMTAGLFAGALSGALGAAIATSGIPMANTLSIMGSSLYDSFATSAYTGGQTDVFMSMGFGTWNLTKGTFNTIGSKGNSTLINVCYVMGALANVGDLLAGFNSSSVTLRTENDPDASTFGIPKDLIGHTQITLGNQRTLIDWGPLELKNSYFGLIMGTNNYEQGCLIQNLKGGKFWDPIEIKNVNLNRISKFGQYIDGHAKYNLFYNSCVSMGSRALNMSGIFNIGIHPYLLHTEMFLRSVGVRPFLFAYMGTNL